MGALLAGILVAMAHYPVRADDTASANSCWLGVTWDEFGIRQEDVSRFPSKLELIGSPPPPRID